MAEGSHFKADAAFSESLEKRVSAYERKSERAKRAWLQSRKETTKEGNASFVDVPEFKIERKYDNDTGKVTYELGQASKRIATPHLEGVRRLKRRA